MTSGGHDAAFVVLDGTGYRGDRLGPGADDGGPIADDPDALRGTWPS